MNGYIYSVVCMAAACGIVIALTPDKVKKHLRLICSLCILCVVISPVTALISGIRDVCEDGLGGIIDGADGGYGIREKYEEIYDLYLEGGYGNNIGQAVKDCLFEKFGIKNDECRVSVVFEDKNGDGVKEPREITVILSKGAVFSDPSKIKSFVGEIFQCQCSCALE